MRRKSAAALVIVMALVGVCIVAIVSGEKISGKKSNTLKIGVSFYKSGDTFMDSVSQVLKTALSQYGGDAKIDIDISYAKNSQRTQNEQIRRYIALEYDVICVNIVERTNASVIVDLAREADIPLIFFNREPVEQDIKRTENVYYIGTDARQTAVLEGRILVNAFKNNPSSIDKNGDGVVSYVMLEGETGHQDSIVRTDMSVRTIQDEGIEMKCLASDSANWSRQQAQALTEVWAQKYADEIEAVIANNDDMALGAISALKNAKIENVAVLGIDATKEGKAAVESGDMLGTVDVNAQEQGEILFELAAVLAADKAPEGFVFTDARYIRVQLNMITKQET